MDDRRMWWWTLIGSVGALLAGLLLLLGALLSDRVSLLGFMSVAIVAVAVFGVATAIGGLRRTRGGPRGDRPRS